MSKIPTVFQPKGAFNYILARIKEYPIISRVADISPYLLDFFGDPTIQEIFHHGQGLTIREDNITADKDTQFQSTLKSLHTSMQSIQKQLDKLSNNKGSPPPKKSRTTTKPTPKTYLAIAGARAPNTSLIVDLAHLGLADDTRPRPEVICSTLNERLRQISPPQAMLAAVRWTARGNLVITGAPSATPHTLQIAAPHISAILMQAFQIPSDKALPAARPNVKWSKISINGVPTCHCCVQEVTLDQSWYLFDDKLGKEEHDDQCVDKC
jgi:hypothetical protein